ncbi:unnamed protein product [Pleuronectes platessa]|uniref:Uncharacterized protein n=1 Tax=Pleuronectes platessa TaxID=8262 RepID=A0A9N7VDI2_PLEPL|nr:unnamed protein product [Pleuronectes platessa]
MWQHFLKSEVKLSPFQSCPDFPPSSSASPVLSSSLCVCSGHSSQHCFATASTNSSLPLEGRTANDGEGGETKMGVGVGPTSDLCHLRGPFLNLKNSLPRQSLSERVRNISEVTRERLGEKASQQASVLPSPSGHKNM